MQITRHQEIIAIARRQRRVSVEDLASRFEVSLQTIRKDLNELCEQRLLTRFHGGAIIASGVENIAYEARRSIAESEKRAIGNAAAALIPDSSSLFINIGTTTEEVARALKDRSNLMVVTNNLHVVTMLYSQSNIEVIVAGGAVRRADGGVVGMHAIDLISQFKVDYAIIGVSAIDEDGTLLDFDLGEVRVAQAIITNARTVLLVADRTKFERSAPARIGHIRDIDIFVTDSLPSEQWRGLCAREDVNVIEAVRDSESHDFDR